MNVTLPLLAGFLLTACSAGPETQVVARVGGEVIRTSDFEERSQHEGRNYGEEILHHPEGAKAIKKKILNALIEERLLAQEVKKKGVALTPEDEKKLSQLSEKPPADWLERQRQRRRIEILIEREVTSKINPSPEEVRGYYASHRDQFREPAQVRCRQITTAKREKAEKVLALLQKGENFAALAQKYSESPDREEGGDLGFRSRGELPLPLEEACFTLSNGRTTSEILSSEYGFHIVRVIDRRRGRTLSLKEATPTIVQHHKETQGRKALESWLDSLYKNTKIQIDEEALERVSLTPETQPS